MNSTVKKRSIVIGSHKTSISLEDLFWTSLKEIARERATTVSEIIGALDGSAERGNLSSTIRVFVLEHYLSSAATSQRDGQINSYGTEGCTINRSGEIVTLITGVKSVMKS